MIWEVLLEKYDQILTLLIDTHLLIYRKYHKDKSISDGLGSRDTIPHIEILLLIIRFLKANGSVSRRRKSSVFDFA